MEEKQKGNEGEIEVKRKRGRPIKPTERIPDTFENIVKAVVKERK